MQFITISKSFIELLENDVPEMLHKNTSRPHLLVLSLLYKGKRMRFAVPFRSNIPPSAPKNQYFPLPPRSTTKSKHRHGLHYIKMFPIKKEYQEKFWTGNNKNYLLYQKIITENQTQIIKDCQEYLNNYEAGNIPPYSVDIDAILSKFI